VQTVVARFHHVSRDLDELESEMLAHGAQEAQITGYVVAMTFDAESHAQAAKKAKRVLDGIGATRLKVVKRGAKLTPA
jgi:hypothetical protein